MTKRLNYRIGIRVAYNVLVVGTLGGLLAAATPSPGRAANERASAVDQPVNYARDIKPILSNHCYACHGPDEKQRKAELRLDVRDVAVKDAIVPGKSADSELVKRVSSADPEQYMPPPDSKKPRLTADEMALVRRWIDQGARYDAHWAYVKPARPTPPSVKSAAWAQGAIDRFVAATHEARGFSPSPEADRATLIRRLSFDLTGLPPTFAEVETFVADDSPLAYEKLVDRLLGSKHYGERMAMYWLDLVRYADTNGIHGDNHRDHAPYRDFVIAAFNDNKPFDRFTTEQLAGDLLPDAGNEEKIASGYNRLNLTTQEGGAQAKEYIAKYAADRVRNASSVWMASTIGCCECHDHKYDPFATKDFYRLAAFFADVQETPVGEQPPTRFYTPQQTAALKGFDEQIAAIRKQLEAKGADGKPLDAAQAKPLKDRRADLEKEKKDVEAAAQSVVVTTAGPPRVVRVLPRGNWLDESGEVVPPGVPAFMPQVNAKDRRATRLDLAGWLTSRENPLVARVMVNRLWKLYFGQGLVASLEDFGTQGGVPSHPELLDWLAVEFIESGWDVKHVVKLMVMSRAYRQSSATNRELRERDPMNVWLARQGRFRLDAEMVRDGALAASGLLSRKIGGASVKPYQPAGYWAHLNFPTREWQSDHGESLYRRGLYTYWCRTFLHPGMAAFDAPSREECIVNRPRSNTPLQALVLLNDPTYVEAARALAERTIAEGGKTPADRVRFLIREALSREPRAEETQLLTALAEKHAKGFAADAAAAQQAITIGESKPRAGMDPVELATWTSVSRVVLNLHETVTRN